MNVQEAYNEWSKQYDTNANKTRDIEAVSLRETLKDIKVEKCLEIGCGTGKNTEWLLHHSASVTAVDLSDAMLHLAKNKITSDKVKFIQADINNDWHFAANDYELVTFSLVLEHIEDLTAIFKKVNAVTKPGSKIYVGELHPFKQYTGTKARFDTPGGQQIVTCFNHHVSDFTQAAAQNGFSLVEVKEYFDDGDKTSVPRILTLLFQKKK